VNGYIYYNSTGKIMVTSHVVRLKLFRLKAEGGQKVTIAVLWRKYLILAPNMNFVSFLN
jgi:hypothetical protein